MNCVERTYSLHCNLKFFNIVNVTEDIMEVQFLSTLFVGLILHIFANEAEHFTCGPDNKCSCFQDPGTKDNITMDCSGKQFDNLSEICDNLGNATRLDASSNNIKGTVDDSAIHGCQNLLFLSLRNNSVTDIERNVFMKISDMRTLDLSRNKLPIYSPASLLHFSDLVNLETLKINGNPVDYSETSQRYPDLSGNKNLTSLYIDGLRNDNRSFPTLTELKTLALSGFDGLCDIGNIHDNFFASLPQLETLDLSFCELVEISMNAFSSLRNLKWLDLSNNRRLGMRSGYNISYSLQFTQIDFLNFSYVYSTFGLGTEVSKLDICFLRNTTLREVALDGNRIQMVETNAAQLMPPTLQILHMNDNKFTFGPYLLQMACVANLSEFYVGFQNIAHNPLRYSKESHVPPQIPTYVGYCPFMVDDYLRNISGHTDNCHFFEKNESIAIYPAFPKYLTKIIFNDSFMKYKLIQFLVIPLKNSLEYFDVSGNVLFDWEGPIGLAFSLKYLDLSRNYCTKIGKKFFEYMTALENLQIHSNFLGLSSLSNDAPDVFHNLTSLKTMNLSFNKITSLHPKSFESLQNLETIDLSYNSIDSWTLEVETMPNLTNVSLRNNALQSLPASLTKHLLEVSRRRGTKFTIDLRNNVLKYACQTKEFLFWMIDHRDAFVGFSEYHFVDDNGDSIATKGIETKMKELEKKCQSNVVWIVISCIGVSVALSVIIFGLVYRNRWKLRYFMYMSKQRFYGYVKVPNDDPLENYKYDAFISYAEENIRFVKDQIIPRIEMDDISLCIHQRDFLPGNAIADNIVDAIQSSRKTVVLLTKAFLKKKWCMYEFNMARMENIYSRDGRSCLVLVMLEDVPTKDMAPELLDWIRRESYLEYSTNEDGENLFWSSLAEAIRH